MLLIDACKAFSLTLGLNYCAFTLFHRQTEIISLSLL